MHNLDKYMKNLFIFSVGFTFAIGYLFYYSKYILIILLMYPGIANILELVSQIQNFKFQLKEALSQVSTDIQIIRKMYISFILIILRYGLDFLHHLILIIYSGFSFGSIFLLHSLTRYFN